MGDNGKTELWNGMDYLEMKQKTLFLLPEKTLYTRLSDVQNGHGKVVLMQCRMVRSRQTYVLMQVLEK